MFARILICMTVCLCSTIEAQVIYKCPDANGRLNLQDSPCTNGVQQTVRPASGKDQTTDPKVVDQRAATQTAKSESQRLRESVGKMQWEREKREMEYEVRDAKNRLVNLDAERDAKVAAIRAEFTTYRGEVAADIFRAKQESRVTNIELEYQRKLDAQEKYIAQIETKQASHEKRRPE